MKTTIKDILSILKVQFSECRETFFFQMAYGFCMAFQSIPMMIFPSMIIDEIVGGRSIGKIIIYIGLLAVSVFAFRYFLSFIEGVQSTHNLKLPHAFILKLAKKMFVVDYYQTEKADFIDQYDNAGNEVFSACGGVYSLFTLGIALVVKFILLIYVISTLDSVLILILILFSLLNCFFNITIDKIIVKYQFQLSSIERHETYAWNLFSSLPFAKDYRMYTSDDYVENRYLQCAEVKIQIEQEKQKKLRSIRAVQTLLSILQMAIIYAVMVSKYHMGLITIGSFTLYISAANEFYGTIASFLGMFEKVKSVSHHYHSYRQFMELPKIGSGIQKVDTKKSPYIEFQNVSFRYPGRDAYALRNINLVVRPNEHIAIVGDNGAGKTTLIKLLVRLYEPTEGAILLNGKNINEYEYEQYMGLFSPVFQDFKLLAYSIKENIAFENYDETRFEKIVDRVGLRGVIEALPNRENTFIKKEFESSGIDLSGGEKQKIAIARAFYKHAAIAILDEPTAAIDPLAEYEIYRNFFELSKGKTTFLISHRMGSTRFCDRIIVLENGEICEIGSHKQLMEQRGAYFRMYQKQASYYTTD